MKVHSGAWKLIEFGGRALRSTWPRSAMLRWSLHAAPRQNAGGVVSLA